MTEGGALLGVLEEARRFGFLGPGPVSTHLESAERFRSALAPRAPSRVLDLGSGGGVPGLALAQWLPDTEFVLLDSMEKRTKFLEVAVATLGWVDRVRVLRERAEEAGRSEGLRGRFDAVTARSFGAPAVTAECGAPLLRLGGVLVVSEPPEPTERWPADGLAVLGLQVEAIANGIAVMAQVAVCPERYPRRSGLPAKRPLF